MFNLRDKHDSEHKHTQTTDKHYIAYVRERNSIVALRFRVRLGGFSLFITQDSHYNWD